MTHRTTTPAPTAGLLEEIDDQVLDQTSAGVFTKGSACGGLASWALGNDGWVCTVTVECMGNCSE